MHIQFNCKNCFILIVLLFFLYLAYLLYFGDAASSRHFFPTHFSIDLRSLINYCVLSVELAGSAILKVHAERSVWKRIKSKSDVGTDEFVTKADLVSHQIIIESLGRAPGLTLISEEKASLTDDVIEKYRENNYLMWQRHKNVVGVLPSERILLSDITVWIDPLDATQEFTEGLLEFVSVMICISVKGKATFGVIHRPFLNETVWGLVGYGVFPGSYVQTTPPSATAPNQNPPNNVALISRAHAGSNPRTLVQRLSSRLGSLSVEASGGAGYKVLRVLNGTAQLYWHAKGLKKWDMCAPDAILHAAGGHVTDLNGLDLQFNLLHENHVAEHMHSRGLLATLNMDHFKLLNRLKGLEDISGNL